MEFKINEPEITVAIFSCLILIIIGRIFGNNYDGVSAVIFSILLVKNVNSSNKTTLLYIKRVLIIIFLVISLLAVCFGYQ
ncbi:MAG: hypothetical protein UHK60_04725 [Acutalibacteraceae bacterium]|nr:hypothetical protein [Acutalibacteraceae bacterium]